MAAIPAFPVRLLRQQRCVLDKERARSEDAPTRNRQHGVTATRMRQGKRAMALTTAIRRTTITTHDMTQSMRFWADGLGFTVWYDEVITDPAVVQLLGVPQGTHVRVAILEAEPGEVGKIGLMQFLNGQPVAAPALRVGPPSAGEVVIMFKTERMRSAYRRLNAMGFSQVGEPALLEVPGRPKTYEMAMRDPNNVRVTLVQFGELDD
jgi:catechol 2,3-dioxygenase-like lactoylglutathione lyase family enzyme